MSVIDDIPTSYLPDERPGMIVPNVAFTTFTFSPSSGKIAFARSASMPMTVRPSLAMNSFGA